MSNASISINPNIQGGAPSFIGTRVPVTSLFNYLEAGDKLDFFLSQFPRVTRAQAIAVLKAAKLRVAYQAEVR